MDNQFIKKLEEGNNKFLEIRTSIKAFFKLFFFLFCGTGALLVLYYCSNLRYFPSDIMFGDTLLFVWVSVCFAFFAGMMLLIFIFAAGFFLIIIRLIITGIEKTLKKTFHKIPKINCSSVLAFIFVGPFAILALGLIIVKMNDLLIPIVFAEIATIGLLFLLSSRPSKAPQKIYYSLFICAAIFFIFFANEEIFEFNINTVMKIIGIRIPGANIAIEKEFAEPIDAIIKDRGMDSTKIVETDNYYIYNVDVLFTGIGKNNFLEFSDKKDTGKRFKFIVPKENMLISYK